VNVALCEAAVTFPSGRLPPRVTLQWQQQERIAAYQLLAGRSNLVLLPTGKVDITLHARGCEQSRQTVEIGSNESVTTLRLVLRSAQ
jgi:hypothetical protein